MRSGELAMDDEFKRDDFTSVSDLYLQLRSLQDENHRLQQALEDRKDNQSLCPVTKLPNGRYFENFLKEQVTKYSQGFGEHKYSLIFISVDNLSRIKYLYGDNEVDGVLRDIAHLLKEYATEELRPFRLHGATFAMSCGGNDKAAAVVIAENIRNKVADFVGFVEKTTVSLGVVDLAEILSDASLRGEADKAMHELAQKRVGIAKSAGMNVVCSESDKSRAKEAGLGRVMVVDTDRVNVSFLRNYLEDNHFEVLSAFDGVEALEIAQQKHPDVIISEAMLPKVDGFYLREQLMAESSTKSIYFMLISHLKNEDSVQRAISLQIEHYFKKPYIIAEVIGIVRNRIRGVAL
jgi:diguanylate cyclase (GGDEF)-like protein